MTTQVFYFSGTGNSFAAAKQIAGILDAECISIPSAMKCQPLRLTVDRIGIVFPSYLAPIAGVPDIVLRFIQNLADIERLNIFAVCTCGGYTSVNALPPLDVLEKAILDAGGQCHAAYSVRMPMNNLDYAHIPVPITTNTEHILAKSKRTTLRIGEQIKNHGKTRFRLAKRLFLGLMSPLFRLIGPLVMRELLMKAKEEDVSSDIYNIMRLTDKSITVRDNCNGCGLCQKVCPVDNIRLVQNRPSFLHHCEMCFACDEWCPAGAIQHWSRKEHIKYRHPDITLKNMVK